VSTSTPIIRASGLVKTYGGVAAVDDVALEIHGGEIVGLIGKNGAGKSTVIKMLAGSVTPDDGVIEVGGERKQFSSPHEAQRSGVAMVPQELADVPTLSVAENVELGLGYPKHFGVFVNWRKLRRRTREALAKLDAQIDPAQRVGDLSPAQQRLVMICRGLAAEAKVLILDEPSASLTPDEIEHLHRVLRGLREEGVGIVYVSHRLEEILALTDRVVVMRDGRVVESGPTSERSRTRLVSEITGEPEAEREESFRHRPAVEGVETGGELLRVEGLGRHGVVENVSFEVAAGEILGIAGLVGAGRTELARLICGADRADTGTVFMRGKPLRLRSPRDAIRAGITLLPEDRKGQGIIEAFGITRNLTLATLSRYRAAPGIPAPSGRRERKRAGELMDRLQVKASGPEQKVVSLSGGNQQKVMMARWVDRDPDVFIFDEPTLGIDVGAKQEIYRLIEELTAAGKAAIVISSDFAELVEISHRILVMREGQLVAELDGGEVDEPKILATVFDSDRDERAEAATAEAERKES
jgi:ABC-type sugar transport system ATPase subunit